MASLRRSKRSTKEVGQLPPPVRPFTRSLEGLGLCGESGERPFHLDEFVESGTNRPLGWYREIGPLGRDGLASEGPPYWMVLELIVPHYRLLITAWSELFDDPDQPTTHYMTRDVDWELGSRMVHTPMYWGEEAPWRRYRPVRVDELIEAGGVFWPWIGFEVGDSSPLTVAIDEDSLAIFLALAPRPPRQGASDRKLQRKLVHFLYACDRDAFPEPVCRVASAYPGILSNLQALLPSECNLASDEYRLGKTVRTITDDHADPPGNIVSQNTVRRAIHKLGCEPISRRRPFVYRLGDCARIHEYLIARERRSLGSHSS